VAKLVALLRGVNVGGSRKLAMSDLRSVLESLGLEEVVTVIQSGNAVFRASPRASKGLAKRIEQRIDEETGLDVTVLLRTPAELAAIETGNPFLAEGAAPTALHVVFLERAPEPEAVSRLEPGRSPPDAFHLTGSEIYVRYPNGSGRSKLTLDYFERTLAVRGTARNWNTVRKLGELAGGALP
jgi:uncharacterized protein (DUF1697 family)